MDWRGLESKRSFKGEQYTEPESAPTDKSKTPEELIDAAYQMLDAALKQELLDLAKKMDPLRFEQLVLDLLVAMGYGAPEKKQPRSRKHPTTKELTV